MTTTALSSFTDSMTRLDTIASESALLTTTGNPFTQAVTMATAIQEIRSTLTDEVMQNVFMPLMNTKLGFRTDKDPNRPVWNKGQGRMVAPEPYGIAVVRECLIEATLRGLPSVGNCWNIIAQQAYVTKEGFWFLIGKRVEGLTDFKLLVGVPKNVRPPGDGRNAQDDEAKGALVTCSAMWKLNGKEDRCDREIPIRVNAMMGADAIMGKAERKILAAAYAQITGTTLGDADTSELEPDASGMRDAAPAAATTGGAPTTPTNPYARKEAPTVDVAAEPVTAPATPAELTPAQRKDAALEAIDRHIATDYPEPINRTQFEAILRKQNLLGPTGTLMGMRLEKLENVAASLGEIAKKAREGSDQ